MSVPNQKIIYIKRTSDQATRNFFKVSNSNLAAAATRLDGKAFKLWVYLADNKNSYRKEMYPVDFCKWSGLSYSSYRRAWEDLKQAGYILEHPKQKNTYLFVEESEKKPEKDMIKVVDDKDFDEICKEFVS